MVEDLSLFYVNQDPDKSVAVAFIMGNEAELEFPDLPLHKGAKEYAKEHFRNKEFTNIQTGWSIRVNKNSYRHESRRRTRAETLLAYLAIPDLIRNGVVIKDEPDKSNKPFIERHYTFAVPLMIDKELYRVRFTVQKTTKGRFYYSTNLIKNAGLPRSTTRGAIAPAGSAADRNPATLTLSELLMGVNEKDMFIRYR